MRRCTFALLSLLVAAAHADYTITLLHMNDTHGHMEPTKIKGHEYGGFARQLTLVKQVRAKEKNVLFTHSGDAFQGTLFFRQYTGLADLSYFNVAGVQAATLGNHEFDLGPGAVSEYVKRATFPVVAANLDLSQEPLLRNLVKPYTTLTIGGQTIGIVGAVTPDTPSISSPGPTVVFKPAAESVQAAVDELTKQKVNKIVLLSHLGYDEDLELAKHIHGVDVILGAHSHTLLGDLPITDLGAGRGPYPTEAHGTDGDLILVAQAYEWGKVLGNLKVTFDGNGRIKSYSKNSQMVVDEKVAEDPTAKAMIDAFSMPINDMRKTVIADAKVTIEKSGGSSMQSPMGCIIADSMVAATKKAGAQFAFMNQGGVRSPIPAGKVTFESIINVQPFGNTLTLLDLTGEEIMQCLNTMLDHGSAMQVSREFRYTIIPGSGREWIIPTATLNGKPLEMNTVYRFVTNNFMAKGGDFMDPMKNSTRYRLDTGIIDADALIDYVKANSPLTPPTDVRIEKRS